MSFLRRDVAGAHLSAALPDALLRKWRQALLITLLTKPLLRLAHETASPPTIPLPPDAPRPQPIEITFGSDWILSDRRLELYQKCPRRFFYTHVLGLGGARKATAFARTHDCLYELIRWMSQARLEGDPAEADAEAAFETIWQERGPMDHAFAGDYRHLASRLVGALVRSGAGRRFQKSEPLAIDFPSGRVVVEPNERAEMLDGKVVLRRVRTGYRTRKSMTGLNTHSTGSPARCTSRRDSWSKPCI